MALALFLVRVSRPDALCGPLRCLLVLWDPASSHAVLFERLFFAVFSVGAHQLQVHDLTSKVQEKIWELISSFLFAKPRFYSCANTHTLTQKDTCHLYPNHVSSMVSSKGLCHLTSLRVS